jgi:hypothetical protein
LDLGAGARVAMMHALPSGSFGGKILLPFPPYFIATFSHNKLAGEEAPQKVILVLAPAGSKESEHSSYYLPISITLKNHLYFFIKIS